MGLIKSHWPIGESPNQLLPNIDLTSTRSCRNSEQQIEVLKHNPVSDCTLGTMMRHLLRHVRQWKSTSLEALDRTVIFANFLCALHVTYTYLCSPTIVYGPSMLPTLNLTGDVVLAEHVSSRLGNVGTGDVVLLASPTDPNKTVTKRILGMEGDRVTYVINPIKSDRCKTIVVPKGHVWIQGDNIYASTDSRQYGPVPYGLIKGRVFFRVWPLNGFGSLGQWQ